MLLIEFHLGLRHGLAVALVLPLQFFETGRQQLHAARRAQACHAERKENEAYDDGEDHNGNAEARHARVFGQIVEAEQPALQSPDEDVVPESAEEVQWDRFL